MLDSDPAELYGVETRALNRAAKRNEDRFPEDFRFKLTRGGELDLLRCRIGTLAGRDTDSSIGRTYFPHVYTKQGVAMLSGVLRSKVAIDASVRIMRAFVGMRHFIADNAHMFEQIRSIDHRLGSLEHSTDERFERVFNYMETHEAPSHKVFFEGQVYDAFGLLVSLVQRAKREIETLNAQYPKLMVRHAASFHDRFLILDRTEGYLIGASLKDTGKKSFAIARIEDASIVDAILGKLSDGRQAPQAHR